ncbi:hypothetical protein CgunFtcFv8_018533 [Champsocephalus gunnari]|uniref:Uncharacterized protein n=1 Tax=Champsocephalus gunnari TaxID=52237 RepID=A0AAN8GTB3_CHAGU|nr:hypothetical protein CgunFtcFv8_018533 [Champsocephalus gunnari]
MRRISSSVLAYYRRRHRQPLSFSLYPIPALVHSLPAGVIWALRIRKAAGSGEISPFGSNLAGSPSPEERRPRLYQIDPKTIVQLK